MPSQPQFFFCLKAAIPGRLLLLYPWNCKGSLVLDYLTYFLKQVFKQILPASFLERLHFVIQVNYKVSLVMRCLKVQFKILVLLEGTCSPISYDWEAMFLSSIPLAWLSWRRTTNFLYLLHMVSLWRTFLLFLTLPLLVHSEWFEGCPGHSTRRNLPGMVQAREVVR